MNITLSVIYLALCCGCSSSDPGVGGEKSGPGGPGRPGKELPSPVTVAEVVVKSVPIELKAFGTVEPNASVQVKSQVSGELIGVQFKKGQDIAEGDLLFTIDARPAKAQMQLSLANLARNKVQYENARVEFERQKQLFEKGLISETQYNQARTSADALAAALQADEASIQSAKLGVAYSTIKSPISGRTGDLLVHLGNLVKANDAVLVTINQIQPIRVAFSLPQRELPEILRLMNSSGSKNNSQLAVQALIPGDEDTKETGHVALVNNAVDSATGTIMLWGEFENSAGRLWPGQLVNTVLTLGIQENAVVVPTRAIQNGQQGAYVFVVKDDNTVENRPIEVARTHNDETIVAQGLKAKERVVTDGQLRLRPGSLISIRADGKNSAQRQ